MLEEIGYIIINTINTFLPKDFQTLYYLLIYMFRIVLQIDIYAPVNSYTSILSGNHVQTSICNSTPQATPAPLNKAVHV